MFKIHRCIVVIIISIIIEPEWNLRFKNVFVQMYTNILRGYSE